jgi:phosphoserine phosphatase
VAVYLISGGFRAMIEPVAERLAIAKERVIANAILFHDDGSYAGFDANEPTSRSGGKATAIARLQAERALSPLIMIGDGVTDLEARPPADGFIGFGGVVVREKVKAGADWFVTDFDELTAALTAPVDP